MAYVTMNPSTEGLTDISGLLKSLTTEREQKYTQGLDILQQVASMMSGGEFDKYAEQLYETARKKTVGEGMQSLISSGLMGTERAMQPGLQFEQEVGTPFRLGLAEQKAGRIATALGNVANYMQTGTPEAGTLAYLATGGFGALSPEQKMAMQEFPYLMQAAQAGSGTAVPAFPSTTGGTVGGGSPEYGTSGSLVTGGGTTGTTGTAGSGNIYGTSIIPGATQQGVTESHQTGGAYTWEPESAGYAGVGAGVGGPVGAGVGYEYAAGAPVGGATTGGTGKRLTANLPEGQVTLEFVGQGAGDADLAKYGYSGFRRI